LNGVLQTLRGWLFPAACAGCGAPGIALCSECAPRSADALAFLIDDIPGFALGAYAGPLRAAVVAMKRGERDPVTALAGLLARAPFAGVIVPLPTTPRRVAERGFDQSVALARLVAAERGLAWAPVLAKRGRAQEGRGRRERLAACGRFRLMAPAPPEVTLLDDVCTTGATARDAAGVLRAAGSRVCGLVVVARADGTVAPSRRS
jgi:predicted amidophosphoribosyltransferase